ncbi:hypothetical protein KI387_010458, partial [Taxus chinensis]
MAANRGAMAGTSNVPRFSSSSNTRSAANSAYYDRSHLQYYTGAVKVFCGQKTKTGKQKQKGLSALHDASLSDKRRIKLLELVSKDLSALSHTFAEGKDAEKSLAEEVRAQIFLNALEVVMAQFEQVKAERRQKKIEIKAQKKAQKKLQKKGKEDSSSSSESSDSECKVIDVAQLRMTRPANVVSMTQIPEPPEITGDEEVVLPNAITAMLVETPPNMAELHRELAERKERLGCRQVQVCMGGKCKKLGSEQVLAAFEESIQNSGMGSAVEAVGCKCMGKCRNAPNVRVQNDFSKELHMG